MPDDTPYRVMILAGEVSGDMHGAALVRTLRRQTQRPIEAYGIGGDHLAAEGVELFAHTDQTGIIGLWEVVKRAPYFHRLLRRMTGLLDQRRPDLLLTVDYPGLNFRVAARAKARGIPAVHYICPQVWAWRRGRIPKIAASLDRLITLFPFESALFEGTGLDVVFAGHPLVDRAQETWAEPPVTLPWSEGRRVALFPGSRPNEVRRLLPDLLDAALETERRIGPCSFLIPSPTEQVAEQVRQQLARHPRRPRAMKITRASSRHVLRQAEAAVVKSGTSTLEASLMLCPTVIVYRVSALSYGILRHLITGIRHVGLVNIIAGKEVCRELIQRALTPSTIAAELTRLLDDAAARTTMLDDMRAVNRSLGASHTDERAAQAVLEVLERRGG